MFDPKVIRGKIDELLAEPSVSAEARERQTFPEQLQPTDGSVVLFGAGSLGQLCARALRCGGVRLRAFCDRNPALHGRHIDGTEIICPDEAAKKFGYSTLFVVSIWTGTASESMKDRVEFLHALGCRFVANFAALVWAYGREETPYHAFDLPSRILINGPKLRHLSRMIADRASLITLHDVLRQRLHGTFDGSPPVRNQYFPGDIFVTNSDEVFIDGGAFTGDTLDTFLAHTGERFREYHAFEPDSTNASKLRATPSRVARKHSVQDFPSPSRTAFAERAFEFLRFEGFHFENHPERWYMRTGQGSRRIDARSERDGYKVGCRRIGAKRSVGCASNHRSLSAHSIRLRLP